MHDQLPAIDCADHGVQALLDFVTRRMTTERQATGEPADRALVDVWELTDHLLHVAGEVCAPSRACELSPHHLDALVTVAALHAHDSGFDRAWLRWRKRPR